VNTYLDSTLSYLAEVARYHEDYERARPAYEQSIVVAGSMGLRPALSLANLAAVALHDGDYRGAVQFLAESWEACSVQGIQRFGDFLLTVFAGVFAGSGQPVVVATLLGSARAEMDRLGASLEAADQRIYDQVMAATRQELDSSAFQAAWEQGQAMNTEQAFNHGRERWALAAPTPEGPI
jgi:hypothetical protein